MRKVTVFAQHDMWVEASTDRGAIDDALTFLHFMDPRWSHRVVVLDFPEPCVSEADAKHPYVMMIEEAERVRSELGLEPLGPLSRSREFSEPITEENLVGEGPLYHIKAMAHYYTAKLNELEAASGRRTSSPEAK